MRIPAYGDHAYSRGQLNDFAEAQLRFDDAWYREVGVPYGCEPLKATGVSRAGKVTEALRLPLAIAGWGFRVLYLLVAVPAIVIFLVSVVWVMFAPGGQF